MQHPTNSTHDPTTWFVRRGREQYGPFSWSEVLEWARAGRIGSRDLLSNSAGLPWTPARQVPGLTGPGGGVLAAGSSKAAIAVVSAGLVITLAGGGYVAARLLSRDDVAPVSSTAEESGSSAAAESGSARRSVDDVAELAGYSPAALSGDYVVVTDYPYSVGGEMYDESVIRLTLTIGQASLTNDGAGATAVVRAVDHQGNEYVGTWDHPAKVRPDLWPSEIQLDGGGAGGIHFGVDPDYPSGDAPYEPLHGSMTCGNGMGLTLIHTYRADSDVVRIVDYASYPLFDVNHFRSGGFGTTDDVPLAEPQD